ncbi:MAG TPA: hypothetical protein VN877_01240 [Opitutaceae bacterium]|nr:hypothetical protein [Opitutaceae bacterium]
MKRLAPFVLAAVLAANSGCHMFSRSKKAATPKESTTLAADDEKDFMHRWIDKRTAELITQGMPTEAARAQASAEFKAKFSYLDTARQEK